MKSNNHIAQDKGDLCKARETLFGGKRIRATLPLIGWEWGSHTCWPISQSGKSGKAYPRNYGVISQDHIKTHSISHVKCTLKTQRANKLTWISCKQCLKKGKCDLITDLLAKFHFQFPGLEKIFVDRVWLDQAPERSDVWTLQKVHNELEYLGTTRETWKHRTNSPYTTVEQNHFLDLIPRGLNLLISLLCSERLLLSLYSGLITLLIKNRPKKYLIWWDLRWFEDSPKYRRLVHLRVQFVTFGIMMGSRNLIMILTLIFIH